MEAIFSEVLNMSFTASVVILVVLLARFGLKKAPKIYSYALWSVVLFRLLCPVSIQSPVSVLEVTGPEVTRSEGITTSVSYIPADYVRVEPQVQTPAPAQTSQPKEAENSFSTEAAVVVLWLTGVAVMLLRSGAEYLQLRRKLVGATPFRDNVYLADHISTPFAMGIVLPKIYLPSNIPSWERRYIVAHERHHIRRGDHIIKLLAYFALSLHWFNPLAWVAFVQAGKDMEMSCDEAVIKKLGPQIRADYSASLLRLATGQRIISGAPLAFGEGDTKGRIRNMARWKKPKLWVSAAAVVICIGILIACGMNPEGNTGTELAFNSFHVTIPEEYIVENADYGVIFRDGETQIGGLAKRTSPFPLKFGGDYPQEEQNSFEWLESLGIPDVKSDWTVGLSDDGHGIDLPDGFLRVNCHPVGEEEQGTLHFLCFGKGNDVYDLWFDRTMIEDKAIEDILNTAYLKESSEFGVEVGDIPYGYYLETAEHEDSTELFFVIGSNTVGGVTAYPIPEGVYDPEDSVFDWLEEVGIPDFEDTSLAYVGGITAPGGGWLAEFTSDVPEGTAITVDRRHHFYPIGDTVYDIWFDMMLIDLATSEEIRQAVKLPTAAETEVTETSENAAMNILFVVHPENEETHVEDATVLLSLSSDLETATIQSILGETEVDLPDYRGHVTGTQPFSVCYQLGYLWGGGSAGAMEMTNLCLKESFNIDVHYNAEISAADLTALFDALGGESTELPGEDIVDFTALVLSDIISMSTQVEQFADGLLPAIYASDALDGEPVAWTEILSQFRQVQQIEIGTIPAESTVEMQTAEDIAFEKVKAVFDTVQSGSYQILDQQKNEGNEGPGGYTTTYFDDGENWLRLHEVLTEGTNQTEAGDYYNRMAHLTHKGFHYSNDGHWGEQGAIQWSAITAEQMDTAREGPVSKLASFQWIKANVTYMDTLTDETGECLMFRIDKMYADQEDYTDHYFANFYFDPSGNFRNVQFQVNLYQDNAFTVAESIVTLDHETVAEQINSYYGYGIPVKETTGKPVLSGDTIDANVEMLQYGILTMTLPEGYTCREESGSIILTREGTDVGGITCWAMPEVPLENDTLAWYRAMGLPEAQESDVPIAYMGGSSPYGDIEAEFFNELDPEALNVEHHFFIDGDIVYDVYYDQNVLSDGQAEKFLKTIAVSGEPVVTPDPSEEESLIKCRNVLSLVQSGSYAIARDRKNQGTVALNDYSYRRFWQHEGNWLSIAEIPESGGSGFFYYMEVDGVHYNTERTGWDENGPIWAEQRKVEVAKPWLATFRWDPDIVTYENTLINGGEECVMLRIDEPYPYGSDNSESYFVNFYFADGGAFLRVELQVNLFLSNAFTETESIITLDAETIAAEIEKEYLRAIS